MGTPLQVSVLGENCCPGQQQWAGSTIAIPDGQGLVICAATGGVCLTGLAVGGAGGAPTGA
jgi:hypothetical protein